MRGARLLTLGLMVVIAGGCFTRTIARKMGVSGWFRADLTPSTPEAYKERFAPVPVAAPNFECSELTDRVRDATSPIIVLVHGVGGEGEEMLGALPALMKNPPASVFMFRWVSYQSRDEISQELAAGVTRIAECIPDSEGRLLILAHSAGGVVSSFAASQIQLPRSTKPGPWVTLLTVASPLAGTVARKGNPDGGEESVFMLDLGTQIAHYPAPSRGVRVVHLRTHAPADAIMKPTGGVLPNDPTVGVPGAPQLELPGELTHAGAMIYVAEEVAADRWKQWRDGPN